MSTCAWLSIVVFGFHVKNNFLGIADVTLEILSQNFVFLYHIWAVFAGRLALPVVYSI